MVAFVPAQVKTLLVLEHGGFVTSTHNGATGERRAIWQ